MSNYLMISFFFKKMKAFMSIQSYSTIKLYPYIERPPHPYLPRPKKEIATKVDSLKFPMRRAREEEASSWKKVTKTFRPISSSPSSTLSPTLIAAALSPETDNRKTPSPTLSPTLLAATLSPETNRKTPSPPLMPESTLAKELSNFSLAAEANEKERLPLPPFVGGVFTAAAACASTTAVSASAPDPSTPIGIFDSLNTFSLEMMKIKAISTFDGRIEAFKKLLKPQGDSFIGAISMANNKSLQVVIRPSKYLSNGFDPESFPKSANCLNYNISFYESEELTTQNQLLCVRASEHDGELVWLGAGKQFSGTELCNVYLALEPMLGVDMYIYDDAKMWLRNVTLPCESEKGTIIYLKASRSLGRPDGLTLYEKNLGFKVTSGTWVRGNTEDSKVSKRKEKITQKDGQYPLAKDAARKTRIKSLSTFYLKVPEVVEALDGIISRCFNSTAQTCFKTIHELEQKLTQRVLEAAPSSPERIQAENDQYYVHNNLYYPYKLKARMTPEEDRYWKSIHTMATTFVFVKKAS